MTGYGSTIIVQSHLPNLQGINLATINFIADLGSRTAEAFPFKYCSNLVNIDSNKKSQKREIYA